MAEPQVETGPLRILVVDDEEHIRFALTMSLEAAGHRVVAQGTIQGALVEAARHAFDLIFLDVRLGTENGLDYIPQLLDESPWARIVVITAYASIDTAVEAMKRGASDYLPKPFEHKQLLLLTQKVAERRQIERQMAALQQALGAMDPEADFPTVSGAYRDAIELARRLAPTQTSVMISGEAGTGRARLARAIHAWSLRPAGPFVAVSARAESAETLEAELFGGGNAGAVAHAHGGTLLIEDVAEFPPRLQPRLLALLRDKEFERVDAPVRRPIDVRVIATAGPGLDAAVQEGRFRMDLFGALSVVRIDLPPLRDRPDDVPLLAERYLARFAREHHRPIVGFTRDALFLLNGHTWPGNARELRNVIERAVLVCNGEQVGLEHLPAELVNAAATSRNGEAPAAAGGGYAIGDLVPLDVIEELHIRKVLATARTTRRASAILGINPSTLFRKLRRLHGEAESKDDSDDQADDDQPTP